jgi:hypothetical protein
VDYLKPIQAERVHFVKTRSQDIFWIHLPPKNIEDSIDEIIRKKDEKSLEQIAYEIIQSQRKRIKRKIKMKQDLTKFIAQYVPKIENKELQQQIEEDMIQILVTMSSSQKGWNTVPLREKGHLSSYRFTLAVSHLLDAYIIERDSDDGKLYLTNQEIRKLLKENK